MSNEGRNGSQDSGWLGYPKTAWHKLMFRLPIYLWRLGLGWLLPSNFLLLTTTGRKSGQPRRTMVESFRSGDVYFVISGYGDRADWFRNLKANPRVTVQVPRRGARSGRAQVASNASELTEVYAQAREKSPVWQEMLTAVGIEDSLEDVMTKADRLPVVRIERTALPTPPAQSRDLVWVWPLAALGLALLAWLRREH